MAARASVPIPVNEVIRYESPVRAFSRKAFRENVFGGITIPTGARVLVFYASANRDELEWDQPHVFDVRRDATRQLGFGHGAHACAGQALARLETEAMLCALAGRVDRIELTSSPPWVVNNIIRRHQRLPLKLVAA
jgi:cytochrome P450